MTRGTVLQLTGARTISWTTQLPDGLSPVEVVFGQDDTGLVGEVQVAVATAIARPTKALMDAAWRTRGANIAMPVVVVAVHGDSAWVYAGTGDVLGPASLSSASRQLQSVLDEPNVMAAQVRLSAVQRALSSGEATGFSNHFLFASYHLRVNVARRPDWPTAQAEAQPMLDKQGKELISALGFTTESVSNASGSALVLRAASGSRRAIAVLLDESEHFDQKSPAYQLSPVAHGLELATREEVPWLVVLRQSTLRLYPGRDGVGVGQRGQSETYFELDLGLLDPDFAALLPLVFSAEALEKGGTADQILEGSGRYAAELGANLRDRVYEGVVPGLSIAIARRLPKLGLAIDADGLKVAYALTLRILFRILFQAYGEDSELLPAGRNTNYDANSLQKFVKENVATDAAAFGASSSVWFDLRQVWDAIFNGNQLWEVPAYGGSLFDPISEEGALLQRLELPDSVLGPALQAMLTEVTEDGTRGPVDFRSLQVREFGTIYEGLLESSLSLAELDLSIDAKGAFVPAKEGDEIAAPAGTPYFHSASGERKATGSYFTPKIVVDHLVERSVEPALVAHLMKVKALVDEGREREAANLFWDFRVADLAMGSAHFLVAAVDKIERGMRDFLTITEMPRVRAELARLAEKARDALGDDVEAADAITEAQLLRRQIARRCIYGLDINPLAVELSRLALWIHTFVPGLPMSSLDHGLVLGNSLTGIGTIDEALDALDPKRAPGQGTFFDDVILDALARAKTRLADFAAASEADKSEVEAGAKLLAEAKETSETVRRIFDAAVAIRIGDVPAQAILTTEDFDDLVSNPAVMNAASRLNPAHMPYLFPEVFLRDNQGFDVLVGNPPWEKVRWEAAPFWAKVSPGLMALTDTRRDARIAQLRQERPNEAMHEQHEMFERSRLQEYYKRAFTLRGGTHLETSQLMLERALRCARRDGHVALVLPRQLLVLAGWMKLRERLVSDHSVEFTQARNHGEWLFEGVDARYAVVLLSVGPASSAPVLVRVVNSPAALSNLDPEAVVAIDVKDLRSFSDGLVVPWFETPRDRVVFDKIRDCVRLKSSDGWISATHDARWDFRSSGPDAVLASPSEEEGAWRVLMTRHVDPFSVRDSTPSKQFVNRPADLVAKHRGVELRGAKVIVGERHPRIILRHPSRSDDTRTLIATALPESKMLYNKGSVHAVSHAAGTAPEATLALLGLLNSSPLDWWARRFVDRHVTAPVVNNLPIPAWGPTDIDRVAELVATLLHRNGAVRIAGGIDVGAIAARAAVAAQASDLELRAEIDALASRGYGLDPSDFAALSEDFSEAGVPPVLRSRVMALLGDEAGHAARGAR